MAKRSKISEVNFNKMAGTFLFLACTSLDRAYNSSDMTQTKWINLEKIQGPATKANITLPIRNPTEVHISAINAFGESNHSRRLVKPPLYYHTDKSWKAQDVFTYGAIGLGVLFLLSLLIALIALKRRRSFSKGTKSPFLINFSRGRGVNGGNIRLYNGSLQDNSLAATKTTSLSGPAFDFLSSVEPAWSQEVNSLYGAGVAISGDADEGIFNLNIIPVSRLRFLHYIGCGAFGKVWEGRYLVSSSSCSNLEDRFERVALKVSNSLLYIKHLAMKSPDRDIEIITVEMNFNEITM
ncbi:unnamed protein product [Rodentolepis nana]|uniref:Protein kinase domain-containing protein n=1 Tax=Rodentolepis nana TaxID=102285 RepID=A0A0R3T1L7_RODNA|nr:unnamed protein product [Rodentolepis nana]